MPTSPHTARSIADALARAGIDVELRGVDAPINSIAPAESAGPGAITFYRDASLAKRWNEGEAAAAMVSRKHAESFTLAPSSPRALLLVPDADLAFIAALKLFAPSEPARPPGVHPTAVVHPAAKVDPSAHVGPLCVVDASATIGPGAILIASVHVGVNASIGAQTTLHPGARVLDRCVVGSRCLFHPGATIGADGFGFRPDGKGGIAKVPQIGNVVLGDDVEIGANACVDRATIGSTTLGSMTKLDNHVQIGHNCRIGRCCVICGHAAVGGSVTLGDGVTLGGTVGIADGITIGSGATVAAQAGVINDIPPGEVWIGSPAAPVSEMRRNLAAFRRLAETLSDIKKKLR